MQAPSIIACCCAGFAKAGSTPKALGDYVESHNIPGYTAKNDSTLVVKLTRPAAYLPAMMTMSTSVVPLTAAAKLVPKRNPIRARDVDSGAVFASLP